MESSIQISTEDESGKVYVDFENTGLGMTPKQWHNLKAERDAIDEILNGEKSFLKKKYLVTLYAPDRRQAVVIDFTPEKARQRAEMFDPGGGWLNADIEIITMVRNTCIERVLAQEKKRV